MKTLKQKYSGMKSEELVKSLHAVNKSILRTQMMLREDPKAFADMYKHKYEKALIKTMLQIAGSK